MAQFKILPNTYILSPLICFSRKRLFEEMSDLAAAITGVEAHVLLTALNEREAMGSTACAKGICIPHGVIPELKQSVAVLAFGVLITWLCALLSINKYLRMKAGTLYYI